METIDRELTVMVFRYICNVQQLWQSSIALSKANLLVLDQ
jgi:hypothetical protein